MDAEVGRLRRLRAGALKVRAVARALDRSKAVEPDPLLNRGRCAAWRIARSVTGRLRAHPYLRYQRDAGLAVIVANSVVAAGFAVRMLRRPAALRAFEAQLKHLERELADARALTWDADLSDAFGRSQHELRELLVALDAQIRGERLPPSDTHYGQPPADSDWPYLAF